MKKVTVSPDGLMTVVDENSRWMHGNLTSEIKGDYTIDEDSVKRLMTILTEDSIMRIYERYGSIFNRQYEIITGDKNIIEKIQDLETMIKVHHEEEKAKLSADSQYFHKWCELQKQIAAFNQSRRWWERKINLPKDMD